MKRERVADIGGRGSWRRRMSLLEQMELSFQDDLPAQADLMQAYACWDDWRAGRRAPGWTDIDMAELPPALLPSTIVVDVIDGGRDLRFRYWGSAMVELYGAELTGQTYSDMGTVMFGQVPHEQYQAVIDNCAPRFYRVRIRRPTDMIAERLNLRLPIIDDAGKVVMVMTVVKIDKRKIHQDLFSESL